MMDSLRHALNAAGFRPNVSRVRDLTGGCIHQVREVTLDDGSRIVAKINRAENLKLFEEEAEGLRALASTQTVLTPQPLRTVAFEKTAILLMTAIDTQTARADDHAWRRFGEELAALHEYRPPVAGENADKWRYGFPHDNHIGSTLQPNSWRDDWVEFNAINRIGFQLQTAIENDLVNADEAAVVERVIRRLADFIPRHPRPALLHGDLWSGNALPASNGRIAVIDPACSIGDGWADIAMMKLFGGFPEACFESYARSARDRESIEPRIAVYQLYHLLNHVNIFGRGYVSQAISVAQRLTQ